MKKIILTALSLFMFSLVSFSQTLQAKLDNTGNKLEVYLVADADLTTGFSQIEFFIRTNNTTTPFDIASVTVGPDIMGNVPIAEVNDNTSGGFRTFQFGYALTNSGSQTMFANGTDVLLATIVLTDGGIDMADFELIADFNTFSTYLTLTDETGTDVSKNTCLFSGSCAGDNLFHGPDASESSLVFSEPTTGAALPIRLSKLSATKGNDHVDLDWSTSSEINGSHFDVQRSQDLANWTTIGKVDAVGESTTLQEYAFVDRDLPLYTRSSKDFYYRLNMVDNDGSSELSDIRTVRFDQDGTDFIVYPNPTINEVFVHLSSITSETGPATMNVINMKGERVKEVTLNTSDDISVDVSDITAGVYYFMVQQGQETYTQKVIKID